VAASYRAGGASIVATPVTIYIYTCSFGHKLGLTLYRAQTINASVAALLTEDIAVYTNGA